MKELNELMKLINMLSEKEQKALVDNIMDMMQSTEEGLKSKSFSCNEMLREQKKSRPDCPHCHAKANLGYVVKHGMKRGVQRYYCKACERHFVETTNTLFARSRKDAEVWKKFIHLTIAGTSLVDCAAECNIAYQTAFTWRHKLLTVFKVEQNSTMMTGEVQMDEMLIPISYKGNHRKGFHKLGDRYTDNINNLPRPSFKRGTDNKSKSHKSKACVFCMVENGNKGFYAAVPGVGFMRPDMLDKTFRKHVSNKTSLVLVDQYKTTMEYLKAQGYKYMTFASNVSNNAAEHKPEVRDGKHLQHVNAMHSHIRRFLTQYRGVSTKYLENYISLFVWLKNVAANKQKRKIEKVTLNRAFVADCYITRKDIEALPMVPNVA